jgi:hypothetical protein
MPRDSHAQHPQTDFSPAGSDVNDAANRSNRNVNRRAALGAVAGGLLSLSGCPLAITPIGPESQAPQQSAADLTSVKALVDQQLETEYATRGLSTAQNGAWQIFHGILAYGDRFMVDTSSGTLPALEYLRAGGFCNGFDPVLGDPLDSLNGDSPRYGLRVDLEPETKIGQGHRDQWLAVISQTGLPLNTPWIVNDYKFTLEDWMRQAEQDIPRNLENEFSWTMIPLSIYRPTDYRWKARDGKTYSVESLLEHEASVSLQQSACGGTHRLIGIASTLNKRRQEGKPITGVWDLAQRRINQGVQLAKVNQNPDGSYSSAYMHRTGWCRDLGEMLGTTGHVLEFLAIAADDETLQSPWVTRGVERLCNVLQDCQGIDMECGVLYHALHGLVEYQRRMA